MNQPLQSGVAGWIGSLPPAPPADSPQAQLLKWAAGQAWSPHFAGRPDDGSPLPDRAVLRRLAIEASTGSLPAEMPQISAATLSAVDEERENCSISFLRTLSRHLQGDRLTARTETHVETSLVHTDSIWTPSPEAPPRKLINAELSRIFGDLKWWQAWQEIAVSMPADILPPSPDPGSRNPDLPERRADALLFQVQAFNLLRTHWPASAEALDAACRDGGAPAAAARLFLFSRTAAGATVPARLLTAAGLAQAGIPRPQPDPESENLQRWRNAIGSFLDGGAEAADSFTGIISAIPLDSDPGTDGLRSMPIGDFNGHLVIDREAVLQRICFLNRVMMQPIASTLKWTALSLHDAMARRAGLEGIAGRTETEMEQIVLDRPWPDPVPPETAGKDSFSREPGQSHTTEQSGLPEATPAGP